MSNVEQLNREVNEVKGVMRENVNKVMERGDKLERLEGRAEELQHAGNEFQKTAVRYKRKQQCANAKLWIICLLLVFGILVVITAIAVGLGVGLTR